MPPPRFLPRASSLRYRSSRSGPRRPPFRARVFATVLLAEAVKVVLRSCGARLHLDGFTSENPASLVQRAAPASTLWHPLRLGGGAFFASLICSNEKRCLVFSPSKPMTYDFLNIDKHTFFIYVLGIGWEEKSPTISHQTTTRNHDRNERNQANRKPRFRPPD